MKAPKEITKHFAKSNIMAIVENMLKEEFRKKPRYALKKYTLEEIAEHIKLDEIGEEKGVGTLFHRHVFSIVREFKSAKEWVSSRIRLNYIVRYCEDSQFPTKVRVVSDTSSTIDGLIRQIASLYLADRRAEWELS